MIIDHLQRSDRYVSVWIVVPPAHWAVFFPGDAHAPLVATGELQKVVVKVAAAW